ncbi:MAG TPA: T9SS type A sorting domain-containing protein [Chitinophagaceae bacterium]|nr:T9SS type A sorting domain-containing protein [Chitinophagaceae bacterium]
MQLKYTRVFLLLLLILACTKVVAQQKNNNHFFKGKQLPGFPAQLLKDKFHSFTAIQLSSKDIADYCKNSNSKKNLQLQLGEQLVFELELEPSNIVSPDYKLQILTPEGTKTIQSKPDFLYKGRTKEGGQVRLAIKEGFISGSIHAGDKEYFIEPMKRYDESAGIDEFIFYESADIASPSLNCNTEVPDSSSNKRMDGATCRSAAVLNLVDYSVFQHYGNSIEAVENFLLTNLNNVEGVYTSFNFDPADPADTGKDNVTFKVIATYISTCPTCDFTDSTNSFGSIAIQLKNGFFTNIGLVFPSPAIPQFWTMRPINAGVQQLSGVTGSGINLLRHLSDDPLYLRLVTAHETGHYFGCQHDNDMKPGVKSFIMYSAASTNATRFSRLSDFGGLNYSSNLAIKQGVLKPLSFVRDCEPPACDRVKDIAVQYTSNHGPRISWTGNGRVAVNYKLKNVALFDTSTEQLIDSNAITFDGLMPCEDYTVEIKKECSTNIFGAADLVYLNTGSVQLRNFTADNRRNDMYDFSCKASGYTRLMRDAVITVDHTPYKFVFDSIKMVLSVSNLFADGARHRVDITDRNNQRFCTDPFYFQAPYYRDNSTIALMADFNDCNHPDGWNDTLIQVKQDQTNGYILTFGVFTPYNTISNQGTIDSSCMASCNILGTVHGKLLFQSPEADLSHLVSPMLCFDFNFSTIQPASGNFSTGVFSAEGYDGINWRKLYTFQKQTYRKPLGRYISLWDSIPARKLIALDSFHNKNFKVRFVIDDGAFMDTSGILVHSPLMAAFDNVRVDGYINDTTGIGDVISVFPNPVKDEIFIKSTIPASTIIHYRIIDPIGRQLGTGPLTNNRINLQHLTHGIFIVQFFTTNKKLYSVKIVKL